MLHLTLTHNGRPHSTPLTIPSTATTTDLYHSILTHLSLPSDTSLRLLTSGKHLLPDQTLLSSTSLVQSPSLYIISTSPSTISTLRSHKPDPLLRPFGRTPTPKYVAAPRRTRPTQGDLPSDYGFGRVEALPRFADKDRALAILEELRSDPGFLDVMRRKRWRVGALKEMPPEGKVGVDPVCVLGYNTNHGQEIHLRLRTDDRLGFRSRLSMRHVLAHELAHNEVSEHNNEFKELMRWIEREVNKVDWRKRAGRAVVEGYDTGGGEGSDPLEEAVKDGEEKIRLGFVGRLGSREEESAAASRESTELRDWGENERMGNSEEIIVDEALTEKPSEEQKEQLPSTSPLTSPDRSSPTEASARAATLLKTSNDSNSKPRKLAEELIDMGFSKGFATLALRENGNDVQRAAHWLLTEAYRSEKAWDDPEGVEDRAIMKNVQEAVGRLMRAGLGHERLVSALDTLHLYLSNVLRNPGVEQYGRINAGNEGFRRRVGELPQAVEVLVVAGFRLTDGFWRYSSLDSGPLWVTKSVVQEVLVEKLNR